MCQDWAPTHTPPHTLRRPTLVIKLRGGGGGRGGRGGGREGGGGWRPERKRRGQGDVLFSVLFSCGLSLLVGLVERLAPCLWTGLLLSDVRPVCGGRSEEGRGES